MYGLGLLLSVAFQPMSVAPIPSALHFVAILSDPTGATQRIAQTKRSPGPTGIIER